MTINTGIITSATPLRLPSLLIAVLIVTPLASLLGSLLVGALFALDSGGGSAGDAIVVGLGIAFFATLFSFLVVLAALLLIALPLTVLLDRRGTAPRARNMIGLAIAAGIAALFWLVFYEGFAGGGEIFSVYSIVAGTLWVLALQRIDRRAAAGAI